MKEKKVYTAVADVSNGFGLGFRTVQLGKIIAVNEEAAKRQARKRLKKMGLTTYRAVSHPIRVREVIEEGPLSITHHISRSLRGDKKQKGGMEKDEERKGEKKPEQT